MKSENSKTIVAPVFLLEVDSYTEGCKRVVHFLEDTVLVSYDQVEFNFDLSCSALDQNFWELVDSGLEKNRQSMIGLIDELRKSGYSQLLDLTKMKQGYESKVFHTLAHLLDGFVGMDSSFYNLVDDSHQISDSLHLKIKQDPGNYWIVQIKAESLCTIL